MRLRAYRRKKFAFLAKFICYEFYSCKVFAHKVVRLGFRNFSLKQTKVTLVSWKFLHSVDSPLKVKKFEFWKSLIEGNLLFLEPISFVWISLFLITTHFENLIYLALMVWKFKILIAPFKGNSPLWYPQILSNFLKIFAYLENFLCLAWKVKKFKFFSARRLRGTPHFGTPKFCQILSFLSIYLC